jgi:hypothetical protein
LGSQFATLGVRQKAKKCLKLAPSFSALTPGIKWALFPQIMTKGSQTDNWLNVAGCDVLSTEGAKVSTLFDIRQHKRYFTDYRNQNKSSQKVGVAGGGGDSIPHQY